MKIQCKLCGGGNTKCMDVSAGPICKILVRMMSLIFKLQLPVKARYYRYCRYQTYIYIYIYIYNIGRYRLREFPKKDNIKLF